MNKDWVASLMAYDWGGDRGALADIDQHITEAKDDPKRLEAIEEALLEVLQSDAKPPAKEYVCRQLARIGASSSIPVLARLLHDPGLSDAARLALEAIPDPAAAKALRAALQHLSGNLRVGIVNALGERRDPKARAALLKLRGDADKTLSAAVDSALRKITENTSPGTHRHNQGKR